MRLLEAIIDANHRAVAGEAKAALRVSEFGHELPLIALTCIDPRLNSLVPKALSLPEDQFIWLRNAGNIIFDPHSSMTRSLALACAIKGGKEICIMGHTDCRVRQCSVSELLDRFKALGIERHHLPENLNEFFGLFSSERQNVMRGTQLVRSSPLIGSKVPVHGLLINIENGKLEWLVNGYVELGRTPSAGPAQPGLRSLGDFNLGEMKFPDNRIGEAAAKVISTAAEVLQAQSPHPIPPPINRPDPATRTGAARGSRAPDTRGPSPSAKA